MRALIPREASKLINPNHDECSPGGCASMNDLMNQILIKARQSTDAAEFLTNQGCYDFAAHALSIQYLCDPHLSVDHL